MTVDEDDVSLLPGVNVLVGEKDTGKSVWLKMLDYMLGSDKSAAKAFDSTLSEKYDSISAIVNINEKDILLERKWKEKGLSNKILIDGIPIPYGEFSEEILNKLNIPILHFPKGNPYAERKWPQLSFRTLLRHIYRREDLWFDFADKQFDSEQHAALSLFFGFAEKLFPNEYGDLVSKQKKVTTLQEMKDQFVDMLQEVSKELVVSRDLSVAFTPESIQAAKERLRSQIEELYRKRNTILEGLKKSATDKSIATENEIDFDQVTSISDQIVKYRAYADNLSERLSHARKRLNELRDYLEVVKNEEAKLIRVQIGGTIIGQLKAKHCPVCDSSVEHEDSDIEICYLCKKPQQQNINAIEAGKARIDFDLRQLQAERLELNQLIIELEKEEKGSVAEIRNIETEIHRLKSRLKPINTAVAIILPPDIGLVDQEIGGLEEQILQLDRIAGTLEKRSDLSSQIRDIEKEIASLKSELEALRGEVDFQSASDTISDSMNSYLNALNTDDQERWTKGKVSFKINERSFDAFVSGDSWSTPLGATSKVLFLLSYHYGLLSLSGKVNFHYPGLVILDFPVQLADGTSIADKENYLIEPFVNLLKKQNYKNTQFIAAGRSFEGLEDINRVELKHVWK
jgi:rubrerythrin